MKPIQHPSSNDVLHPPAGATAEECRPLFVTRVVYQPGNVPALVSFWQPTPQQLELLAQGRPVWMSVLGNTHPPLVIGVDGDGAFQ